MNDASPSPEIEALIADAASGDLPHGDAAHLSRLLASDPALADLLEEQQRVRSLLSTEPSPLDDLERRRLHKGVTAALAPTKQPTIWVRLLPAVAAVLVVASVSTAALSRFGGGQDTIDAAATAGTTSEMAEVATDDGAGSDTESAPAAAEGKGDAYVAGGRLSIEVDDLDDVRLLAPEMHPIRAADLGLDCFLDDDILVVQALRVMLADGVEYDVVITADDELLARPVGTCEPEVVRP
jgi:anti-sigma factor RsiW